MSSSIIDAILVALPSLDYVDYQRQIETEVLLPAASTMSGYPDALEARYRQQGSVASASDNGCIAVKYAGTRRNLRDDRQWALTKLEGITQLDALIYQVIGFHLAHDLGSPFWQHVSWKFLQDQVFQFNPVSR